MKLKYYLRTLGLAMMVTTLLMAAASPKEKEPMSDKEIKERAEELGMVDPSSLVLSDLLPKEPEESGENVSGEPDTKLSDTEPSDV
ncbi:MAG: hypothetical protein NC081_05130, partial [Roseburia sp.]|nr:hypothetical protein [Roseburia sp.]